MAIQVSDETLRDGEQQAGIVFSPRQKIDLGRLSAEIGSHYINTIPIASSLEANVAQQLQEEGVPITAATLLGKEYVDHACDLGLPEITLFTSVSDILLDCKDKTRDGNLDASVQAVTYAKEQGLTVDFAMEDATRADEGYLMEFVEEISPFVRYLVVCDTVGCAQPNQTSSLFSRLASQSKAALGVHCHNDLGNADANTVAAVLAGAELISGTYTGIGERAGNASLGNVFRTLKNQHHIELPGFDYDRISEIEEMVRNHAGRGPVEPGHPCAYANETGIHVHALMRNPQAYCIIPGQDPEVYCGKYSGVSNFKWIFERVLDEPLSEERYTIMRDTFKGLATQEQRSFSTAEVIFFYREGII